MEGSEAAEELPEVDVAAVERFFAAAVAAGAVDGDESYGDADCFGDTPDLADELVELVLQGQKRATAGSVAEYEAAAATLPTVGDLCVATDGRGQPRALIRTTEVRIGPLSSVDERFAWDEGEGDRTRADWLRAHTAYFMRAYDRLGLDFHQDISVVFERFALVYPEVSITDRVQ